MSGGLQKCFTIKSEVSEHCSISGNIWKGIFINNTTFLKDGFSWEPCEFISTWTAVTTPEGSLSVLGRHRGLALPSPRTSLHLVLFFFFNHRLVFSLHLFLKCQLMHCLLHKILLCMFHQGFSTTYLGEPWVIDDLILSKCPFPSLVLIYTFSLKTTRKSPAPLSCVFYENSGIWVDCSRDLAFHRQSSPNARAHAQMCSYFKCVLKPFHAMTSSSPVKILH